MDREEGSGQALFLAHALNLSFRDVINDSDTHTFDIVGDGNDTINLDSFVGNDPLSGGHWSLDLRELTSNPTKTTDVYDYTFNGSVMASVVVGSDVHVNTPFPPLLTPDHHF